jgi:glycosyltransferase involved in cell wall biosynthesis
MKIMVITPYFYPKIGGMENYVYHISKGLREKYKWNIVVVTSNHEKNEYKEEVIDGLRVFRLPYWFKLSNTPINPLWWYQIRKILIKEKPDLINAHTPVPFIADIVALICGNIPFYLTYHGDTMKKNEFVKDLIIGMYENTMLKFTLNKAQKIICCSDFIRNNFLKDYLHKSLTITPAVDINLFKPKKNFPYSALKTLFVGSLNKAEKHKGLDNLIDAIRIVKESISEIELTIVGNGNNINYYKKKSIKLGINKNIVFKGKLLGAELVKVYQEAGTVVLPSTNESFGMVLIEAMACKKPVIGTRVGGIKDLIEHGKNGLLVCPDNTRILANAIIKILTDKKLAEEMGKNGYDKVVKNFIWNKQVEKTNKIFNSIL